MPGTRAAGRRGRVPVDRRAGGAGMPAQPPAAVPVPPEPAASEEAPAPPAALAEGAADAAAIADAASSAGTVDAAPAAVVVAGAAERPADATAPPEAPPPAADPAPAAPGSESPAPGPEPHAPPEAEAAAPAALSFAEACRALAVSPHVLRRVMDDYEEILPPLLESGPERRLPAATLTALSVIVSWRNAGVAHEEILRRLRGGPAAESGGGAGGSAEAAAAAELAVAAGPALDRLLGEVTSLHDQMRRSEERQAEDRDRLLTALMRTHQEIQHLRFEVAAAPRRERRRGLWARLFR